MLQSSDIWTTLCEVTKKYYTCFVASFAHKKRVQKVLCGDGNDKERWKIPSEDTRKWVTDETLQRNCPEMQKLTPFQLRKFLPFWLRYTAFKGIILRVFRQSTQRYLNLVSKRWKFLWKARSHSFERGLDHWSKFGKVDKSLRKITLQTEKWGPFTLVTFPHWLRYAETVSRVMYAE